MLLVSIEDDSYNVANGDWTYCCVHQSREILAIKRSGEPFAGDSAEVASRSDGARPLDAILWG